MSVPFSPLRRSLAAVTAAAAAAAALVSIPVSACGAASPITVQASVRTGGFEPGHGTNGLTGTTRLLSRDGRYVVFASSGPVVPGQKQLGWQIVRRDRQLGTTELISKSSGGVMGNAHSYDPSISADGQVIAFRSAASNLVAGDSNGQSDVFVHDARTGRTLRASATSSGAQVPGDTYMGPPSISADGRWVGFVAQPAGYAPGDSAQIQAYLRNVQTGAIEVVSRDDDGAVRAAHVGTAVSVSSDGSRVAFQTLLNNHAIQVLVRDRVAGTTTVVGGEKWSDLRHSVSPNGRYVVYDTGDASQVLGDTNASNDVFLRDLQTGVTERVSLAGGGGQGNGHSTHGSVSDDGRYVSFRSEATNLVAGDTNGIGDVFRHDRLTKQTIRINLSATGAQATASTHNPAISGDGQHVAFDSYSRLTPAATKGWQQVYVRDLAGRHPALFAQALRLPARVNAKSVVAVGARDIRTGPALQITWTPTGGTHGKAIHQRSGVSRDAFALRAPGPKRAGRYVLTVRYADHVVGSRTVTVVRPAVTKLAAQVKRGKKLTIRTTGLDRRTKVSVRYAPRAGTKGKPVTRSARVNAKGVVKVRTAPRRGSYRIVVRSQGVVLKKGTLRVR